MSSKKVSGIVTRYANYRDNDRMVNIMTDNGIIGAAARGCRRQNSPLLSAAELFVYGEFVLFERQGKYTVDSCEVRESFYPLRQDMDRFAAGMHALELVNDLAPEGEKSGGLLKLLYYALSYMAFTDKDPMDLAICFTIKCLALLGYTPAITSCACCGQDIRGHVRMGFDPEAGGAICSDCMIGDSKRISPLSLEAMRRMLLLGDDEMDKATLPEKVRAELRSAVGGYGEHILERRMKSFYRIGTM